MPPLPDSKEEGKQMVDALNNSLDKALGNLNRIFSALGIVTEHPKVRSLQLGDLPPVIPAIWKIHSQHGHITHAVNSMFHVHENMPDLYPLGFKEDALEIALHVTQQANRDMYPLFPFYELFQEARQDNRCAKYDHGIKSLGTSIEILLHTVMRIMAEKSGSGNRSSAWSQSGLRNVVTDHIPRLLNTFVPDIDNPATPIGDWWEHGYKLRNKVVHEGHRTSRREYARAFEAAVRLHNNLAKLLKANERYHDFGNEFLTVRDFEEADIPWEFLDESFHPLFDS